MTEVKKKKNMDLRVLALRNGVSQREIAEYLNTSPSALSTGLARELSKAEKDEIKEAIKSIAKGRQNDEKRD